MKKNIPPEYKSLARKISGVEIIILLILIMVWISVYFLMNTQQSKHIGKMTLLQEDILALAFDELTPADKTTELSWPFTDTFSYFILENNIIIASNMDMLKGKDLTLKKVFGDSFNAETMIKHLQMESSGTDWVKLDKISPKKWISWRSKPESPYVVALLSDEDDLNNLSSHKDFRRAVMVCACLASALLLLALIWALSWLRLSAVAGLSGDLSNEQNS